MNDSLRAFSQKNSLTILAMATYRASSRPLNIAIGLVKFRCRAQPSARLFSSTRVTFESSTPLRPLQCHVGVSYASKDSPPFATRKEADESSAKGFQSGPIARWKDQMLGMGTLRTELLKGTTSAEGGEQPSEVEQAKELEGMIQDRKRWGAGEDFFFIRQGVSIFRRSEVFRHLIHRTSRYSGRLCKLVPSP